MMVKPYHFHDLSLHPPIRVCSTGESLEEQNAGSSTNNDFFFYRKGHGTVPDPVAASMAAPSVPGDSQVEDGEAIPLPWPLTASPGTCSMEESLEEQNAASSTNNDFFFYRKDHWCNTRSSGSSKCFRRLPGRRW